MDSLGVSGVLFIMAPPLSTMMMDLANTKTIDILLFGFRMLGLSGGPLLVPRTCKMLIDFDGIASC